MKISFASPSASISTDTSRGLYFRIESNIYLLPDVGNLRTETERTNSLVAISVRIFSTGKNMLSRFLNLCRRLAGSSFRTLLQSFQESSRVQFILLRPSLSFAASHAHNKAWSKQHGAQRNSASGA